MEYEAVLLIIIVILIISTHSCMRARRATLRVAEHLTTEECGLSGQVKLPYAPLSRFTLIPDKDSVKFGELAHVSDFPTTSLDARHKYLARKCDETPGCMAFSSRGDLKSGIVPSQALIKPALPAGCTAGKCGIWVRKCAIAEPLYVELFADASFRGTRALFPVGDYPKIDAKGIPGAIGDPKNKWVAGQHVAGNDWVSSARVPVGLRVTLYENANFGGKSRVLLHGEHASMNKLSFNDKVSSLRVEYDAVSDPYDAFKASSTAQM